MRRRCRPLFFLLPILLMACEERKPSPREGLYQIPPPVPGATYRLVVDRNVKIVEQLSTDRLAREEIHVVYELEFAANDPKSNTELYPISGRWRAEWQTADDYVEDLVAIDPLKGAASTTFTATLRPDWQLEDFQMESEASLMPAKDSPVPVAAWAASAGAAELFEEWLSFIQPRTASDTAMAGLPLYRRMAGNGRAEAATWRGSINRYADSAFQGVSGSVQGALGFYPIRQSQAGFLLGWIDHGWVEDSVYGNTRDALISIEGETRFRGEVREKN